MKKILGLLFILSSIYSPAQSSFNIHLNPVTISDVGGLQSFAIGQYDDKWLVLGGRLDGLHRRQPWASFDITGHNDQLWVIDPLNQESWTSPMTGLPTAIQEQLHSTNMEFHQAGNSLYVIGGYGYSDAVNDHITFPYMTAIEIPEVMTAIMNNGDLSPHFRQISNELFAVTGGYLLKIEDTFYLVGGQRFDGRYNPMDMPTFTQEYTDAIRRFSVLDDGNMIDVTFMEEWTDASALHRRDFNVLPQIMSDGDPGITAFSGVFQPDANIPFLDCVNITTGGYSVQENFSQYYNHYHCASIPMYDSENEEMHNIFFGGIAQYYEENGEMVMDDEVPFVKTIARVSRDSEGVMTEYKLPIEMPAYLGSGAEFIPLESMPSYSNGVIDMDAIVGDSVLIGYIYGGIESSDKNIFWINDGTQSVASSEIYEVYLIQNSAIGLHEINDQSQGNMRMQLYPNAQVGKLYVDLMMDSPADVLIQVYDIRGSLLCEKEFKKSMIRSGKNELLLRMPNLSLGKSYVVRAISTNDSIAQKMIVNE